MKKQASYLPCCTVLTLHRHCFDSPHLVQAGCSGLSKRNKQQCVLRDWHCTRLPKSAARELKPVVPAARHSEYSHTPASLISSHPESVALTLRSSRTALTILDRQHFATTACYVSEARCVCRQHTPGPSKFKPALNSACANLRNHTIARTPALLRYRSRALKAPMKWPARR